MLKIKRKDMEQVFSYIIGLGAGVQPLAGGPGHQPLGDSGGQGIDGHDAPGDLLPPLRLKQGVDHLLAPQIVLHLAKNPEPAMQ